MGGGAHPLISGLMQRRHTVLVGIIYTTPRHTDAPRRPSATRLLAEHCERLITSALRLRLGRDSIAPSEGRGDACFVARSGSLPSGHRDNCASSGGGGAAKPSRAMTVAPTVAHPLTKFEIARDSGRYGRNCAGLENRFGGDSSDEGSNPSPSVSCSGSRLGVPSQCKTARCVHRAGGELSGLARAAKGLA